MNVCRMNEYINVIKKGETQSPKGSLSLLWILLTYPGCIPSLGFMGLSLIHSILLFSSGFFNSS